MLKNIYHSARAFSNNPVFFVLPTIYWIFVRFVYIFSIFLVLYLLFAIPAMFATYMTKELWYVILTVSFLVFTYWDSGIKGSLIDAYASALRRKRPIFMGFYTSGKKYRLRIFMLNLLRLIISFVLVIPFLLVYIYFIIPNNIPYVDIFLFLISAFLVFLVYAITSPGVVFITLSDAGLYNSIKRSFSFIKRHHIFYLVVYFIYTLVRLVNLIPVLNVFSLFIVYPVVYSGIIYTVSRYIR